MGLATINQLAVAKATTVTVGGKKLATIDWWQPKWQQSLAVTLGLATDAVTIIMQQ